MSDLRLINTTKEYGPAPLFLAGEPGLFDTINKSHPEIWNIYKNLKSQDWDAGEFDYSKCAVDFKMLPKDISQMMIRQLAWQWEADSLAARSIVGIMAPYIASDELSAAWMRVADNENVHAETYSEIVRQSFDNPSVVLDEVTAIKEAFDRSSTVDRIMFDTKQHGLKLALGLVEPDQEAYNHAFKFVCALYMLERIQFMSSFAITAIICKSGHFDEIATSVQKISVDEFACHAILDRAILETELKTDRGQRALQMCHEEITTALKEVVELEYDWVDYQFKDDPQVPGMDKEGLKRWTLYCAEQVFDVLSVDKSGYDFPEKLPLHLMKKWFDLDSTQKAPMEQNSNQYRVNVIKNDDDGMKFAANF